MITHRLTAAGNPQVRMQMIFSPGDPIGWPYSFYICIWLLFCIADVKDRRTGKANPSWDPRYSKTSLAESPSPPTSAANRSLMSCLFPSSSNFGP